MTAHDLQLKDTGRDRQLKDTGQADSLRMSAGQHIKYTDSQYKEYRLLHVPYVSKPT